MKYIIEYVKLKKDAVPPIKAHPSDAGWDLTVSSREWDLMDCIDECDSEDKSNDLWSFGCGLAFDFSPVGYALAFPRSSTYKTGLILSNCVGVIDGGYRGEISGKFIVHRLCDGEYKKGDRFLQLVFPMLKIGDEVEFKEVEKLNESDRGANGYGSTGK